MTIAEKVVQILRNLSDVRQQEVLDFGEFLQTREESTELTTDKRNSQDNSARLVRKDHVLVIETPPLDGIGDVNQ